MGESSKTANSTLVLRLHEEGLQSLFTLKGGYF